MVTKIGGFAFISRSRFTRQSTLHYLSHIYFHPPPHWFRLEPQ